jgi:hypothetical protein
MFIWNDLSYLRCVNSARALNFKFRIRSAVRPLHFRTIAAISMSFVHTNNDHSEIYSHEESAKRR